ncbi:hypothetical protein M011DRAFT_442188 [Sporormia fimetaria CBS 119925]|uniref:Autophagy-related protein 11 n=1 Tax=Sporormia fimetaria CBS 119925 TaxID=1340428 RepID=A0A6A6VBM8_9PLEO|nr:hypothetical protein M011DRAFT_442188 [Sporormia fimetaria CBS 119925]
MSLQVAVAHTGQRLDADRVGFNSIDALKQWISSATQIPADSQILLTTRGKHVKLQALLTEPEIFVYNRDYSNDIQSATSPEPLPDRFVPDDPPDTLSSHTDLRAWQNLFQARRDWAFAILEQAKTMSRMAADRFLEQSTIDKGTQIAVGNHDSHIRNLEGIYQAAKEWWDTVFKETGDNLRKLDADWGQLDRISARAEFLNFFAKDVRSRQLAQGGPRSPGNRDVSLQEFIDAEALRKAAGVGKRVRDSFSRRVADMGTELEKVAAEYGELLSAVDQSQSRSIADDSEEPGKLYSEIRAVAEKVDSDFKHVMGLQATQKSVAQVSKMALLHTRNFLPAVREYSIEMSDLVRKSVTQRNAALRNALDSMQNIASIESRISRLSTDLEAIDLPQEAIPALELVSLVSRIPHVYGTLLVEAVRRREWMEKIRKDTSSLAEEMATYQEEEERRRKKWLKPISDVVNVEAVQGNMLKFEMNVQTDKNSWPAVRRDDLQQYLSQLRGLEGQEANVEALEQAIKDLDRPTKQQVKRAKNFKMGSIHEPFGRGSQLLLRGDDDVKVLKEANAKLEDELKTSKSRVRRLEDLLHRQNHVHRLSVGGGMPSFGPPSHMDLTTQTTEPASPRPMDEMSRRSSVSSRRFSTNQGQDDKRRIVRLEHELALEKEARTAAENDLKAKSEQIAELKQQIEDTKVEEAVSTKENIMENMKALQREFSTERQSLEKEVRDQKTKIEEVEDEMDRMIGSRDNERTGVDTRIQELQTELEKARTDATKSVEQAEARLLAVQAELGKRRDMQAQHRESLSAAFATLSSESAAVPNDFDAIVSQLEELAIRSSDHCAELEQAIAIARAENETVRHHAQEEAADLRSKVDDAEARVSSIQEQLDTEKGRVEAIAAELKEERGHLADLRKKFAEGETGSEALRKRVAEEEEKVGRLQLQLVEAHSRANTLDIELMHAQKRLKKTEELGSSQSMHRAKRATELSQRLYAQTDRLLRLLETLGYIVTYDEGNMVLQRPPKVKGSSSVADSTTLARSVTTPSPTPLKRHLDEAIDSSFLQWAESNKPEEEEQRFNTLLENVNKLNLDTFSEAVAKRSRDLEHTIRKWQKEARGYRDKAHRFQAESHDKIAYRSFKEGDLALFLPTRNQVTRPWAAFNVGAPHYFLREQDSHRLHDREWLLARISKVEERVVDLSKTIDSGAGRPSIDDRSIASNSAVSIEDDNPFELSDGLRWYLLHAAEEKSGAPGTPGLGKTTVASVAVTGEAHLGPNKRKGFSDPAKALGKSLDSRRSSGSISRKSVPFIGNRNSAEALRHEHAVDTSSNPNSNAATRGASPASGNGPGPSNLRSSREIGGLKDRLAQQQQQQPQQQTDERRERNRDVVGDEVRNDLLWGP